MSSEPNAIVVPPAGERQDAHAARADGRYRLTLGLACCPGWRGELLLLAAFALATIVLTWPMAVTLGQATGTRGDYLNNLWNAWWLKDSLVAGHSPYWTDYLFYPDGISLRRHTLSPLNSLALAGLGELFGAHQAFSLLVMGHFALSAWCFSLLARYVTGSTAGGVLGGLVYSFCPFHYFYLCQINVFSFEFLPLALLFWLKQVREGGRANLLGVVASLAGMAATIEYYVVYAYLAFAVLCLCWRGWAREIAPAVRLRRLLLSGALGAVAVAVVAFPLLSASLGAEGRVPAKGTSEMIRFNDLLGFFWIGGPESSTVSWPTMLGYSTLALILSGWRRVLTHWPWLVTGAVCLVLSMGNALEVGGHETGIPLPYLLLRKLPVLSMLRKSDRFFMLVQLVAGVALAAAWAGLSTSAAGLRSSARVRVVAAAIAATLMMVELTGVPFRRFEVRTSPGLAVLRDDPEVRAVMELPVEQRHLMNARTNYYQTIHGKKTTLGYTTSTAVTPQHDERLKALLNLHYQFIVGQNRLLPRYAAELGVQRIVHYKSRLQDRPLETAIDGATLWKPFVFWSRPLMLIRQVGEFEEQPYPAALWEEAELKFTRALGAPVYEDDFMVVYAVPGA